MSNILANKVIIVSGGSGLLGKAFIQDLKNKGAIVYNADITVKTDLDSGTLQCDVSRDISIKEVINTVTKKHGHLDGIVNNAYPRTKDWGISLEKDDMFSWRSNVDLQLNSYVAFCKYAIEAMLKLNCSGSIVNITSIYGVVGNDPSLYEGTQITPPPAYSAIKGGVINFTRYLAAWYGKKGIRVNCVSPGGILDKQDPLFINKYNAKVPLGRMGNAEDISPAVSFLLSDEAKYITGQNLIVDGGWTSI
ncbi:3-oxoacyl-[acyl-carrier-protein] reductase FabG [compost metagenome]